jgi:hypothetical protein
MKNVKVPIFITSYYPKVPKDVEQDVAQEISERTPIWRNIRIENVTVTGSDEVGRIVGVAEMPIQGITLTNVNIAAKKGLRVVYARGIEFLGCQIQVESGDTVMAFDAEVKGLRNP